MTSMQLTLSQSQNLHQNYFKNICSKQLKPLLYAWLLQTCIFSMFLFERLANRSGKKNCSSKFKANTFHQQYLHCKTITPKMSKLLQMAIFLQHILGNIQNCFPNTFSMFRYVSYKFSRRPLMLSLFLFQLDNSALFQENICWLCAY